MTDDSVVWQYAKSGKVDKIIVDWVSDSAAGTVSAESDKPIHGTIARITTDPGSPAPSADYDITLLDEDSVDVALGTLANRHTTTTQTVYPTVAGSAGTTEVQGGVVNGRLTLTIANAGNSKKGKVTIYLV